MKRLLSTVCLAAFATFGARAELASVELGAGVNAVPSPSRALMLHAISTNAAGTVTLKKVTALDYVWLERRTVTNVAYTIAWSNLTHTVTNDIVSAWRTNAVGSAVLTNFLASAVNAMPSVYPWPDLLVTTNKEETVAVYTNIPYAVEAARSVDTQMVPRHLEKYVTNDICTVTLSGGFKTNAVDCVFAPGDYIVGSGTAFAGGKVQLIIAR